MTPTEQELRAVTAAAGGYMRLSKWQESDGGTVWWCYISTYLRKGRGSGETKESAIAAAWEDYVNN